MNKEKKIIPELRFPEFLTGNGWTEKPLGDITYVVSKRNKKNQNLPVYSINNQKGFISQTEQFEDISSDKRGYDISQYKVIEKNTFAYNPARINVGSIGYSGELNNIIISSLYVCFKTTESINDEFLLQFFNTFHFKVEVLNNVEGGIRNYLFYENFSKIRVSFPSIQEQRKIASFLSSLDELIVSHEDKLLGLKDHKKGLIQNIFPQEGEKVPNYRFPEFKKNGEWEYLNGDKLFEPISNKNHNSDLPILAITQEHGAIPREKINYSVVASEQSIATYKIVETGDFIISLRSFQGGIEYSNYKGICSPAYIILRKKIELEDMFFKYYFKSDLYIRQLNKNLEGIRDGKMVSYQQFSEIKLPLPSIKEQQQIASCLTTIEELINEQKNKVEQLKEYKIGLMQSLFPNNNF